MLKLRMIDHPKSNDPQVPRDTRITVDCDGKSVEVMVHNQMTPEEAAVQFAAIVEALRT